MKSTIPARVHQPCDEGSLNGRTITGAFRMTRARGRRGYLLAFEYQRPRTDFFQNILVWQKGSLRAPVQIKVQRRSPVFRASMKSKLRQSAPKRPRLPAVAYCQGTLLRNEIEARDAGKLEAATDYAESVIAHRHGSGEVAAKIQAHVIVAVV